MAPHTPTLQRANALAWAVVLALGFAGLEAAPAGAVGIAGQTIDVEYVWPTLGSVYADLGMVIAGTTPQRLAFGSYFAVSVASTQIIVGQSGYSSTYSGSFNGEYIIDQSALNFPSYTVDAASVLGGGTPQMTVVGNTLEINFAGLTFGPGSQLVLDVGSTTAPEPGSLALLGMACAALALLHHGKPRRA